MKYLLLGLLLSLIAHAANAGDPVLAPNAPKDQPVQNKSASTVQKAIQPYVERARATYPEAKQRFLAGLPKGQYFFLTTALRDSKGNVEQVFIAVTEINAGSVTGKIWSDILGVEGYRRGQLYTFAESQMVDWLITKPDGSEEGNVVGKFLDTYDRR